MTSICAAHQVVCNVWEISKALGIKVFKVKDEKQKEVAQQLLWLKSNICLKEFFLKSIFFYSRILKENVFFSNILKIT